ncbi:hypothetical protein [Cytobacillus sp. IB215665]|uniref:hypothetical protein n=1 Tax=Cytobacillus sp. IB215665 TaxID=3097357 RepID=UPI002A0FF62A|nr:hypothetical protein [Cytobacillus sp. IB215665]MDX8367750.1 hypothetical protein [Cytobacillus sp. IB215665]
MKPRLIKLRPKVGPRDYIKEQDDRGNYIPYEGVVSKNTDRQNHIKSLFRENENPPQFAYQRFYHADIIIDSLNKTLGVIDTIYRSYYEGSEDWIIDMSNGIQLIINTYDEYGGDSGIKLQA